MVWTTASCGPLAEALGVVAGVPVRDDVRVDRNLAVGEALHGALVIVVHVGEAHSSVDLGGHAQPTVRRRSSLAQFMKYSLGILKIR